VQGWAGPAERPRRKRSGGGGEQADRRARPRRLGRKPEVGPSSKKFLLKFKLNLGIWLDFRNLHKEI
jgi:hypothetical protein